MYDLKPGQLIECEWLDPSCSSKWIDAADVTAFWKFSCRSVGYVHRSDPEGLTLTACYGEDHEGDRSLLLRQYLPWSCITDLWVLSVETSDG